MTIDISSPQDLQRAVQDTQDDQVLIVDFWSPRCGPCKVLTPILEELTRKYAPQVRLAKINVDDPKLQPLAMQLRIQSVPSVKFIVGGQIAHEFTGAQPAPVVEQYLKQLLPPPQERVDALTAARAALQAGQWKRALKHFDEVAAQDAENADARLGSARCQLFLGNAAGARAALAPLAEHVKSDERARLELLAGLLERKAELGGSAAQAARVTAAPDDYSAIYGWACALALDGHYDEACDTLLRIIEHDKNLLQGQPRALLLALLELLGAEQPQVREYRARLARALFI